jgi:AraC-like DNA-binding protein
MDPRIERALTVLHAQYGRPVSLHDLARAVNLSASRLSHLFRAQIGTSPKRYVHALRIACAGLLLERTHLSLKEVMAQVGFNDPSHFTRDFGRYYGCTPTEWRADVDRRASVDGRSDADRLAATQIAVMANTRQDSPRETRNSTTRHGRGVAVVPIRMGHKHPLSR